MRILGIDPGSIKTGWAILVCDGDGSNPTIAAHGMFKPKGNVYSVENEHASKYGELGKFYADLCAEQKPDYIAIEETIVNSKNPRSALTLANARGSIIGHIAPYGVKIVEVSPTEVKQSITGSGRADKRTVQMMVSAVYDILGLKEDEADAVAVAHTLSVRIMEASIA